MKLKCKNFICSVALVQSLTVSKNETDIILGDSCSSGDAGFGICCWEKGTTNLSL